MINQNLKTFLIYVSIGILVIIAFDIRARGANLSGTQGVWKNYRYVDGLANNIVIDIFQDKEGFIWFGTNNGGVSRFDGKNWKTYIQKDGLSCNNVHSIFQDDKGNFWFGADGGGVSIFDGKNWDNLTPNEGLTENCHVSCMLQDDNGTFWFGTRGNGISRFNKDNWKTYTQKDGLINNVVNEIMQDRDGKIWVGTDGGVSKFDGNDWYTYTEKDGLADNDVMSIIQNRQGIFWFGTFGGGVTRFDGRNWVTFTQKDGLASNNVTEIIQDREGALWFGTDSGVSRFDGKGWVTFTEEDGLVSNNVISILEDREGIIWFGTWGGVSRFDRKSFMTYTRQDGLAQNSVRAIIQDKSGAVWFGTEGLWEQTGGVSRFDGTSWKIYSQSQFQYSGVYAILQDKNGWFWFGTGENGLIQFDGTSWRCVTRKDGLADNRINTIFQDKNGYIWVGTDEGLSRYNNGTWTTFSQKDGLSCNTVLAIIEDKKGNIWVGTQTGGVCRFDEKNWVNYKQKDGLAGNTVYALLQDNEGIIWCGTSNGISRYDGKNWITYKQRDGLAHNDVRTLIQDNEGIIWIGTNNGGISTFDDTCFQSIDSRDGLINDTVNCLYMDRNGYIWIGTEGGVMRFIPNKTPPVVYITRMIADDTYTEPKGIISLKSNVRRLSFNYHAISFKTRPGGMKYFYQLIGHDDKWLGPINRENIEYFELEPREYTFQVRAVDRDLNYSEISSVLVVIPAPPFYQTTVFPVVLSIIGGLSLFGVIILAVQRLRLARAERLRLQRELEDAREMQMRLLPKTAPVVKGFDIAGFSRPAREVGGDFFDYISLHDGKIGLALADVSGKGLKGAMNAVLANGMLNQVAKIESSSGNILSTLNQDLYPRIEKRMFTAIALSILHSDSETLQFANAAQPYPIIKRENQVSELKSEGGVPLGIMPNVVYQDQPLQLQQGDIVIFYTDGINEAVNSNGEMYNIERLKDAIMKFDSEMSAEKIVKAILQDVGDFVGSAEQYDDMTVIVVKKV